MIVTAAANYKTYLSIGVLAVGLALPAAARAQEAHAHGAVDGGLVQVVRQATERFKDVTVAQAEGYELQFGCVTGPDAGAMGMHFVNAKLVMDGELDATKPEIVIYEPMPDGRLRLVGADYLVLADTWDANHANPPELMGQLLQMFDAPNRFKLPRFYTLHVWAWKDNPAGTFVNWHTKVSCDAFTGQN